MFALLGTIMVVVVILWFRAMLRQPRADEGQRPDRVHRWWLVGGGLVLPISAMTLIMMVGVPLGQRMLPLPVPGGEPLKIEVTAHQWWWDVYYPATGNSLRNVIHIPAGQPVDLHLTSADVVHSFWVPRLGGKLDMIPGRTNVLRLAADEPGTYRGACAEFCGLNHAHMKFEVIALSESQWQQWLGEVRDHE